MALEQALLSHHALGALAVDLAAELAARKRGDHPGAVGRVLFGDRHDRLVDGPLRGPAAQSSASFGRAVDRLAADLCDALGVLVENKANGPAVISALHNELAGIIAIDPRGDKVARAHSITAQLEAGNVHLPGAANREQSDCDPALTPQWVQELVGECASFPNAAYDDQVDALSQALDRLRGTGSPYRQRSRGQTLTGGIMDREF